jgi:hypothetical protein
VFNIEYTETPTALPAMTKSPSYATVTPIDALKSAKEAENVPLMRCRSSRFGGHHSVESDSHKTFEFSARKSRLKKRMRIRDEASGGSHQTVV